MAAFFCSLESSDWVSIADIIITTAIGIWIACLVQNNITKNRYLKEYYMREIGDIGELYKQFVKELCGNQLSAPDIKDWFKIMSNRITTFDTFIRRSYKIADSILKDKHVDIQQYITGSDEFNEQYSSPNINFTNSVKNDIFKKHAELSEVITQRVIDINGAKKKSS